MATSLRVLKWIAMVDSVVMVVVAAVVWLGGWLDLAAYGSGLTYASFAVFVAGGLAVAGAWARPADQRDRWLRSEAGQSLTAQVAEDVQNERGAMETAAFCALAGLPLLALGMALMALAG